MYLLLFLFPLNVLSIFFLLDFKAAVVKAAFVIDDWLSANLATKVARGLIGAFGNLKKVRKFNMKFS
jgi:hypothetical protein